MRSAIYQGTVVHQRLRPRAHRLEYRVFSLLLDLDELPVLSGRLRLLGIERPGLFSFRSSDHGDGRTPLREWAAALLADAGIAFDGGRIELLCYPRILGFVFNPLSVYFCSNRNGSLVAVLYEVHNTHGERHTYVIPVQPGQGVVRHTARKTFFVSPFMPMDCLYRFRLNLPAEKVGVLILEDDAEGLLLTAAFTGTRQELGDAALRRLFLSYPLMTLKVVAGIHWEAARLLLKGVRLIDWSPARQRIAASSEGPALEEIDAAERQAAE